MKRITESRKLLNAPVGATLKELNTLYKALMKQHHPDRVLDATLKQEAEDLSQRVISAYKFLESIHPETHAANAAEFERSVASIISDWHYKSMTLHVTFGDGSVYEFYGVPQNTYRRRSERTYPRTSFRYLILCGTMSPPRRFLWFSS
jgi:curved DNA-binding protein CbpA